MRFKKINEDIANKHLKGEFEKAADWFINPRELGADPQIVLEGLVMFLERKFKNEDFVIKTPLKAFTHKGYIKIRPGTNSTLLVHRLVAEWEYGGEAIEGKEVHHINRCPWDNRPKNLEPVDGWKHRLYYHKKGGGEFSQPKLISQEDMILKFAYSG